MTHLYDSSLFYFISFLFLSTSLSDQFRGISREASHALGSLALTALVVAHFIDFEIYYGNKTIP